MTIIEALEAALADGMFYCSYDTRCDAVIEDEIGRFELFREAFGMDYKTQYAYQKGLITGPDGVEILCQTADEVHAERERDVDAEIEAEMERMCSPGPMTEDDA